MEGHHPKTGTTETIKLKSIYSKILFQSEDTMSVEEKQYLEHYDIEKYERPSVTADMAVFAVMNEENRQITNYRKDPAQSLKLLLIKRANHPYKDSWALPGGFCQKDESTTQTARRELCEETGIRDAYLRPFDIFDEPDRDPRGWIISHAFLTLIDGTKCSLHAATDARAAEWFSLSVEKTARHREIHEEQAHITNSYRLTLACEQTSPKNHPLCLTAEITETKTFVNYHETVAYDIVSCDGIAFDHAKIILCAFLKLQNEVNENGRPVFDLMPEKFTLASLQNAFEIVQGKKLITPNFRRKIADFVTETDELSEGAGHRPAKLFKRNLDAFYG